MQDGAQRLGGGGGAVCLSCEDASGERRKEGVKYDQRVLACVVGYVFSPIFHPGEVDFDPFYKTITCPSA